MVSLQRHIEVFGLYVTSYIFESRTTWLEKLIAFKAVCYYAEFSCALDIESNSGYCRRDLDGLCLVRVRDWKDVLFHSIHCRCNRTGILLCA